MTLQPTHPGPRESHEAIAERPANPVEGYLTSLQPGHSRATMIKHLNALAALLGAADRNTVRWHQLRSTDTQALWTTVVATRAAPTANLMRAALRGVLKMAWRMGLMEFEAYQQAVNLQRVTAARLDTPDDRVLSRAELVALFAACAADASPTGRRDAAIFALAVGAAGLRRAEVVGLDLADFAPATGMLAIQGKDADPRTVVVQGSARAVLDDWIGVRGIEHGPLFFRYQTGGTRGGPRDRLSAHAIYAICTRRGFQAGIAPFCPQDLRRTFISDALDAGIDLITVAQIVGHRHPQTTARYHRRGARPEQPDSCAGPEPAGQ